MSYVKRNINLILLAITIVLIGYSLTLTTYYQTTYSSVTDKYYERVQEYNQLIGDLEERERKLNQTSFELTRKIQDKEKLDELYTGLSEEKEVIESDLSQTESELQETKDDLEITQINLNEALSDLDDVGDELNDIEDEILEVIDDLEDESNLTSSRISSIFSDLNNMVDDAVDLTE